MNLAVSLHAVTKEVRDEIVPLNRKYGIEELLQACADYPGANNARRITFEYVMLRDKNGQRRRRARTGAADPPLSPARQGQFDPVQPPGPARHTSALPLSGFAPSRRSSSRRGISAPVRTPRGRGHRRRVRPVKDCGGAQKPRRTRPSGRREDGRARLADRRRDPWHAPCDDDGRRADQRRRDQECHAVETATTAPGEALRCQ